MPVPVHHVDYFFYFVYRLPFCIHFGNLSCPYIHNSVEECFHLFGFQIAVDEFMEVAHAQFFHGLGKFRRIGSKRAQLVIDVLHCAFYLSCNRLVRQSVFHPLLQPCDFALQPVDYRLYPGCFFLYLPFGYFAVPLSYHQGFEFRLFLVYLFPFAVYILLYLAHVKPFVVLPAYPVYHRLCRFQTFRKVGGALYGHSYLDYPVRAVVEGHPFPYLFFARLVAEKSRSHRLVERVPFPRPFYGFFKGAHMPRFARLRLSALHPFVNLVYHIFRLLQSGFGTVVEYPGNKLPQLSEKLERALQICAYIIVDFLHAERARRLFGNLDIFENFAFYIHIFLLYLAVFHVR